MRLKFLDTVAKWTHYRALNSPVSIVNTLHLDEIHEDLSFGSRRAISKKIRAKDEDEWRLFSRDPFIYFYEDYLAKYDFEMKKKRGVYYTPPPVVNLIVPLS